MSKVLLVHDGKRERELLLIERLVVGRDPVCDISVDDGLLSRRHAEFIASASSVTVRDLGSRNGVFVNGTRRAEQTLKPGDVVQIGPLRVRYQLDRAASSEASARMDADGTLMISATTPGRADSVPAAPSAVSPAPMATSFDTFRGPASALPPDEVDDPDGETRVVSGAAMAMAVHSLPADGDDPPSHAESAWPGPDDATSFTPTPRPGALPIASLVASAQSVVASEPVSVPAGDPLGSFILIQLGSLAIVVFVVTVAPLFLSRGTVLSAIADGNVLALLVWPFLPLVISLAATLVFAHVVNRRLLDLVVSARGGDGH